MKDTVLVSSVRTKFILIFALTVLLVGLTTLPQVNADDSIEVVESFDAPGDKPRGLAWDGQYLWVIDYYHGYPWIEKITTDGDVVKSFQPPGEHSEGLAWDGQYLWNGDPSSDMIYKIDPSNGSILAYCESPCDPSGGLAWGGGQYLWVGDLYSDEIYKIDPSDGSVIKSFASPSSVPAALAWGGGQYLWNANQGQTSSDIYKIDPSDGSVIKYFESPASTTTGLDRNGQYLWVSDISGKIYKIGPLATGEGDLPLTWIGLGIGVIIVLIIGIAIRKKT